MQRNRPAYGRRGTHWNTYGFCGTHMVKAAVLDRLWTRMSERGDFPMLSQSLRSTMAAMNNDDLDFTGLVQVTALATTGLEAELRAKAALLSGPARAAEWLPDGGATVDDDGVVTVFAASTALCERPRAKVAT